jgi:hypothetical protein
MTTPMFLPANLPKLTYPGRVKLAELDPTAV